MYRAAAKRLIGISRSSRSVIGEIDRLNLKFRNAHLYSSVSDFSSSASSSNLDRVPDSVRSTDSKSEQPPSFLYIESSKSASPSASSFSSSKDADAEDVRRFESDRGQPGRGGRSLHGSAKYQAEQARVLEASLLHVKRLGWSVSAMQQGARDAGLSPSIVGSFERKEAALVEYFMDKCLEKLMDVNDEKEEELRIFSQSESLYRAVKTRLEMQAPYIAKWPQVLTIQAMPSNVSASLKQRAMLVDEFWQATGDMSSDLDWYVKRTILGGIYSATEIYMLTDVSPEFRDTWRFLDSRVRDAFHLKNTVLEAKYFVEAVGAGMGIQLQRFTA